MCLLRLTPATGFTLAELLIALSILGVIATFAIPKVLQAQRDARYNSIAKEAAATVSEAYQLYKANNAVTAATDMSHLTPYMNYVRVGSAGELIDYLSGTLSTSCGGSWCLRLHNGAAVRYWTGTANAMGGSGTTNAIEFLVDPDGVHNPTAGAPGKSVLFYLYYNGKLRTAGTIDPNTSTGQPPVYNQPFAPSDPAWFSWN